MSLLIHADLLKEYLTSVEGLAGIHVHVDRRFDIREQAVAELSKKTKGAFFGIQFGGWTPMNPDSDRGTYWATLRHECSFVTLPSILDELGLPTFDVLMQRLIVAIHGWAPEGVDPDYFAEMRWRVGGGNWVPGDDTFQVYMFPATFGDDFANPVVVEEVDD